MSAFTSLIEEGGHEQVIVLGDRVSGLRGFVAIHSTKRGPAMGGIRLTSYPSEEAALRDALALSRSMSEKTALAELPAGGGKIVILAHTGLKRRPALRLLARHLEALGGRFFTGRDLGTTPADIRWMRRFTRWAADERAEVMGDLNVMTARGVVAAMRGALRFVRGERGLRDVRVVIEGLGGVGTALARILLSEGARVLGYDPDGSRVRAARRLGVETVPRRRALAWGTDVFSPCGPGGTLDSALANRLRAAVVAGAANNQCARPEVEELLVERGIAYAPDFAANAGAIISGALTLSGRRAEVDGAVAAIEDRVLGLLRRARRRGASPAEIARRIAHSRLGPPS